MAYFLIHIKTPPSIRSFILLRLKERRKQKTESAFLYMCKGIYQETDHWSFQYSSATFFLNIRKEKANVTAAIRRICRMDS